MKKLSKTTTFLTRTAMILALTLLFQMLRMFFPIPSNISAYITGSLVNFCLILAVYVIDMKGGIVISIVAPIVATLQGFNPVATMIIPIAIGNIVYVVFAHYALKNKLWLIIISSIIKWAVISVGMWFFVLSAKTHISAPFILQLAQLVSGIIAGVLFLPFATRIKNAS